MSERKFQMGKIADTVKVLVAEVDRKRRDLRNIVDVIDVIRLVDIDGEMYEISTKEDSKISEELVCHLSR